MNKIELTARISGTKLVGRGDPVWDTLDGRRVRFSRRIDSTAVEIMTDEGRALPDWRHISQLVAI